MTDPVADPQAWLREQLTLDMTSFDQTLDDLLHGDDSPIADSPLAGQLESWRGMLHSVAGWPLTGCAEPASLRGAGTPGTWSAPGRSGRCSSSWRSA